MGLTQSLKASETVFKLNIYPHFPSMSPAVSPFLSDSRSFILFHRDLF